jgi:hypothetical protein
MDDKGGKIATLVAGETGSTTGGASSSGNNMFGGPGEARYVRLLGGKDGNTIWAVENSCYELSTEPKDWISKAFVEVRKIKSVEITSPVAADSWKAERKDEEGAFALASPAAGEELDTAKADGLKVSKLR